MRPFPAGAASDAVGFAGAVGEDAPGEVPRDHLVLHSEAGVFVLRAGRWKLIEGTEGSGGWPSPAGGPPLPGAPGQPYDLEAEPQEEKNLYAARPEVVARLQALLDAEGADAGSPARRSAERP